MGDAIAICCSLFANGAEFTCSTEYFNTRSEIFNTEKARDFDTCQLAQNICAAFLSAR